MTEGDFYSKQSRMESWEQQHWNFTPYTLGFERPSRTQGNHATSGLNPQRTRHKTSASRNLSFSILGCCLIIFNYSYQMFLVAISELFYKNSLV